MRLAVAGQVINTLVHTSGLAHTSFLTPLSLALSFSPPSLALSPLSAPLRPSSCRRVPHLQVGGTPVERAPARLVGAAGVRAALAALAAAAGRVVAVAHDEVVEAPPRPLCQVDLLVVGVEGL